MNELVEQLIRLYTQFDEQKLASLSDVYASDVTFTDPVHSTEGLEALEQYFRSTLSGTTQCCFHFQPPIVLNRQAVLEWRMDYSHPKLRKGQKLCLMGISTLEAAPEKATSGAGQMRIVSHRDYYDLGAMLYEHVPILGRVVTSLKERLKHD